MRKCHSTIVPEAITFCVLEWQRDLRWFVLHRWTMQALAPGTGENRWGVSGAVSNAHDQPQARNLPGTSAHDWGGRAWSLQTGA